MILDRYEYSRIAVYLALVSVGAALLAIVSGFNASEVMNNREPLEVTVDQILGNEVPNGAWVELTGVADHLNRHGLDFEYINQAKKGSSVSNDVKKYLFYPMLADDNSWYGKVLDLQNELKRLDEIEIDNIAGAKSPAAVKANEILADVDKRVVDTVKENWPTQFVLVREFKGRSKRDGYVIPGISNHKNFVGDFEKKMESIRKSMPGLNPPAFSTPFHFKAEDRNPWLKAQLDKAEKADPPDFSINLSSPIWPGSSLLTGRFGAVISQKKKDDYNRLVKRYNREIERRNKVVVKQNRELVAKQIDELKNFYESLTKMIEPEKTVIGILSETPQNAAEKYRNTIMKDIYPTLMIDTNEEPFFAWLWIAPLSAVCTLLLAAGAVFAWRRSRRFD